MKLPLVHLWTEWFKETLARMGASGAGRYALWVAVVALVAHLGFVPGLPDTIFTSGAINYDDPQVLDAVEQNSMLELLTESTYYAYKPLYFASLKIDQVVGGWFGPSGPVVLGHVGNWLLHALVALLLTILVAHVFKQPWLALAVGLLFAVHPLHVESVAWLSERKDTLSLAFALWAHLSYRWRREDGRGRFFVPAIWLLLGGLTKGTVWSYVGVIGVDELMFQFKGEQGFVLRTAFVRLVPLGVVAFGGVALDAYVATTAGPGAVDHGVSTSALVAAMLGVHAGYLWHVLAPVGLALDYAIQPGGSWGSVGTVIGLLLLVTAVGGLAVSIVRRFPLGALASAIWIFGLLPVNNLWPRTTALMADRYLYVPAIGVYLLAAFGLSRAKAWRGYALGALVVLLGILCIARTRTFASSEAVWTDTIEKVPESALAYIQRGQDLTRQEFYARALKDVDAALALEPRDELVVRARLVRCAVFLGLAGTDMANAENHVRELQHEAQAVIELVESLPRTALVQRERGPVLAEAEIFLGNAWRAQGAKALELEAFERAVGHDPGNGTALYDYGTALAALTDTASLEEAASLLERALPKLVGSETHEDALINLAQVEARLGDDAKAMRTLRRARGLYPRSADVLYAEAHIRLEVRGELPKVKALLGDIRALDENHPKARRLQADIYTAEGKAYLALGQDERETEALKRAIHKFDQAVEADPDYWQAHVAAADAFFEQGLFRQARARYRLAFDIDRRLIWVEFLIARTHVLEAAWMDSFAEEAASQERAAAILAGGLQLEVRRIDLGFVAFEDELPLLREVAVLFETAEGPTKVFAGRTLIAAAHLCAGDQDRAMDRVRQVVSAIGDDPDHQVLLDACVLFRAIVSERQTELQSARTDYELLARRRPKDPLHQLRLRQLALRVAGVHLQLAQGYREDVDALAAAEAEWERCLDDLRVFGDAHQGLATAGLAAAEADMAGQRWEKALRRLNELKVAFPDHPSVYRGTSAVYLAERMVRTDRLMIHHLITQASRELQKALTLDPRDVRTHMDASGLARTAGDMRSALRHAKVAWRLERYHGPAARAYGSLLVGLGQKAVEAHTLAEARKYVVQARKVDPSNAASWLLETAIVLARPSTTRLTEAEALIYKAKELEPLNPLANRLLAQVHREMGTVARMRIGTIRWPDNPASDPDWKTLPSDEQSRRAKVYEEGLERAKHLEQAWRHEALRYLDSALAHLPQVPDLPREQMTDDDRDVADEREKIEAQMKTLRRSDPVLQEFRARQAFALYDEAMSLRRTDRTQALELLLEAVTLVPDFLKAHLRIVEWSIDSLPGTKPPSEKGSRRDRFVQRAFMSLHMLDRLDVEGVLMERHLYRGELNQFLFRHNGGPEVKVAAIAALRRYEGLVSEWIAEEQTKPERPPDADPSADPLQWQSRVLGLREDSLDRARILLKALGGA